MLTSSQTMETQLNLHSGRPGAAAAGMMRLNSLFWGTHR